MDTREVCEEYRSPPLKGGFSSQYVSFHAPELGDDRCMNCGNSYAEHQMKEWFGDG